VTGRVETGDEITKRLALPRIDLLKIDVEGHEIEVLSGFATVLASAVLQPQVIQFEYGVTWLPGRHNLLEAYRILEPFGYAIGRLYPDGVDFKPYTFADDHFRMGNYIAVRAKTPLAEKLALFGG
jgi:Methyltransferase FkbM domain